MVLEDPDRRSERRFPRFPEEKASAWTFFRNTFQDTASAERDQGFPTRQRLDGNDAKVFFARQDNGTAASIELSELGFGNAPAELDRRPSHALEKKIFGALAYDFQGPICFRETADGIGNSFVTNQFGNDQVVIVCWL